MYGGTKAELERLIADAASYTDIQKEMGITVDATSMSFDNIVNAIAVVQGHLGIAGATAAEAATTIEGSVNMMKASWSNMTTALANENADVGAHIDEFVGTVGTVVDNVMPRVEVALEGVGKLVNGIIPKFAEALPTMIAKYVPTFIKAGVNILKSLVKGMGDNAKMIVTAAKDLVISLVGGLSDLIPDVIDAGVELLGGIVEAVPEVAVELFNSMPKIIESIASGLLRGAGKIFTSAIKVFSSVDEAAEETTEHLKTILSTTDSFADIVGEFSSSQVDLSKALSASGRTISEIDKDIEEAENKITDILSAALQAQQGLRDKDIENIEIYNQKIRDFEQEKLSIYRDQQMAELRKAQLEISTADATEVAKIIARGKAALDASNEAIENIYSDRLIIIENKYKALGEVGSEAYNKELQDAKTSHDQMLAENKTYYDQLLAQTVSKSQQFAGKTLSSMGEIERFAKDVGGAFDLVSKAFEDLPFSDTVTDISKEATLALQEDLVEPYLEALKTMDWGTASAFLNIQAEIQSSMGSIDEASSKAITMMLNNFQEFPGEVGDATKQAMLNMIAGLEVYIPELKDAANMTVDEIKGVISGYFSAQNGNAAATTFAGGIKSGLSGIPGIIEDALNGVPNPLYPNYKSPSWGKWWLNGSKASGLGYVPFDGYVAELHKGERVLTAQEARSYANPRYGIGSVSITINGASYQDEESLADAVAERLYDMTMEGVEAFA